MSEYHPISKADVELPRRDFPSEQAAEEAIEALISNYVLKTYPELKQSGLEFPLSFQVNVRPGTRGAPGGVRFDPDLRTQILEQAEGLLHPLENYQPGAVYDYHEQSADARACRPPTARSVFGGYDPVGHPTWTSFDEWRETGLGEGDISVRLQTGTELTERQLEAYGKLSHHYRILGQACLGYLPVPSDLESLTEDDRLALTVQVVEIRDSRNQFDLVLNVLAGRLMAEEVDALLASPGCQQVLRGLRKLEEDLFRVRDRALRAWHERKDAALRQVLQRIPGLLTRFSLLVASDSRRPHEQKSFPVLDTQVATLGDLFFDLERDAWVLLGSRETGYLFDEKGLLINSFHASASRVDLRLTAGRWRPALEEEQPVLDLLMRRADQISQPVAP